VKGYIGSTFTNGFAEQMPEYKAQAYKHDAGKITTLLDTHVTDVDARKALADDLIDLFRNYEPTETQAQLDVKAQARSEFETYLFLRSVSKSKHGSLLATLQTQCSLGKEQYPDTTHKAVDILSQHRWDACMLTALRCPRMDVFPINTLALLRGYPPWDEEPWQLARLTSWGQPAAQLLQGPTRVYS